MGLHEALVRFNRKERYLLLEWALGATDFPLDADFRTQISKHCGTTVPGRAFVGMDYHLDWIHAALELSFRQAALDTPHPRPVPPEGYADDEAALTFTQEDIDLLVMFIDEDSVHRVLLIEAKAYSGFSNPQMRHKVRRLGAIFGADGKRYPKVQPKLILTGPKLSAGIKTEGWPDWAANYTFVPMPPPLYERRQVTRCTAEGVRTAVGGHWKIIESKWA